MRVILVDDQELVRSGLRLILTPRDGFDVVAECGDGDEVVEAVDAHTPDVVVMDLRMKRVDGIEATRRLREHQAAPPVIVLTTFDDDELLSGALRAGASGFVLKDAAAEDIIRAVRTVGDGGSWLDPAVTGRVLDAYRGHAPVAVAGDGAAADLTDRELEVFRLMARGHTNAEIAEQLFIGEVTVKSHVGHIFTKLALRDRAAAIVYAYDHGLVGPRS